ncbi:MAG: acyl-CoA dehydrogenase family protein [Myxococcota bacterium]
MTEQENGGNELERYRERVRAWLDGNLERRDPGAPELPVMHEDGERISGARALQRVLFEGGFAGITWPLEYGGQGLSPTHQEIFDQESREFVLPQFGALHVTTYLVCGPAIVQFGSETFKREHVPAILRGDELWCQFFSEPAAGSDLAGVQSRATRDGDGWRISGAKVWSTMAAHAEYGMCLARTSWDVPKHQGLTWFAVPTNAPGLTMRPIRQLDGRVGFYEEFLDEVPVDDVARIGDVDAGWSVASAVLANERAGGASGHSAATEDISALAADLETVAERAGVSSAGSTRQLISQARIEDYVNAQIRRRAAEAAAENPLAGAYAKLAAGVLSPWRATTAMQLGRGTVVAWEPGDEEAANVTTRYLGARDVSISAGSNEMQRNIISERVLGLPREPSFDRGKPFNQILRDAGSWES